MLVKGNKTNIIKVYLTVMKPDGRSYTQLPQAECVTLLLVRKTEDWSSKNPKSSRNCSFSCA